METTECDSPPAAPNEDDDDAGEDDAELLAAMALSLEVQLPFEASLSQIRIPSSPGVV